MGLGMGWRWLPVSEGGVQGRVGWVPESAPPAGPARTQSAPHQRENLREFSVRFPFPPTAPYPALALFLADLSLGSWGPGTRSCERAASRHSFRTSSLGHRVSCGSQPAPGLPSLPSVPALVLPRQPGTEVRNLPSRPARAQQSDLGSPHLGCLFCKMGPNELIFEKCLEEYLLCNL